MSAPMFLTSDLATLRLVMCDSNAPTTSRLSKPLSLCRGCHLRTLWSWMICAMLAATHWPPAPRGIRSRRSWLVFRNARPLARGQRKIRRMLTKNIGIPMLQRRGHGLERICRGRARRKDLPSLMLRLLLRFLAYLSWRCTWATMKSTSCLMSSTPYVVKSWRMRLRKRTSMW